MNGGDVNRWGRRGLYCLLFCRGRASRDAEVEALLAHIADLREALRLMVEECWGLPSHRHLANYVYHAPEHWAAAKKVLEVKS